MSMPQRQSLSTPWYWGYTSPDMISIRLPDACFDKEKLADYRTSTGCNITNRGGGYQDINIHAEALLPGIPLFTPLAHHLVRLVFDGVLQGTLRRYLLALVWYGRDLGAWDVQYGIIDQLERLGGRLVRLEIAWDFPIEHRPVSVTNHEKNVARMRETWYSPDQHRQYRDRIKNGTMVRESKGCRDSLVATYPRALKTGVLADPWRLEVRLQRFHLTRLSMRDMMVDFHTWLMARKDVIAHHLSQAIDPGSWNLTAPVDPWGHWMLDQVWPKTGA